MSTVEEVWDYVGPEEYEALERLIARRPMTAYAQRLGGARLTHGDYEVLWLASQCGLITLGNVALSAWNEAKKARGVSMETAKQRVRRLARWGLLTPVEALVENRVWALTVDGETELLKSEWAAPEEAVVLSRVSNLDAVRCLMAGAVISAYVAGLSEREALPLPREEGSTFFVHFHHIRAEHSARWRVAREQEDYAPPRHADLSWSESMKRHVSLYQNWGAALPGETPEAHRLRLAVRAPWVPGGDEALLLRHTPEALEVLYAVLVDADSYEVPSEHYRKHARAWLPETNFRYLAGNWTVYDDMRGRGFRPEENLFFPPPFDGSAYPPRRWSASHLGAAPNQPEEHTS